MIQRNEVGRGGSLARIGWPRWPTLSDRLEGRPRQEVDGLLTGDGDSNGAKANQ